METNNEPPDVKARTYFLKQGQGIQKIHGILGSNILVHHLKKWLSFLLELVLYLLFIIILWGAIWLPLNPLEWGIKLTESIELQIGVKADEIIGFFVVLKALLVIFSLPVLGMALLLGRNRRKNTLIREASKEAEQMKEDFDRAIVELKL